MTIPRTWFTRLAPCIPLLAAGACGGDATAGEGWQAVRDTVADTVTVRTVSGSVWGQPMAFEEVMSIGVEEGAEEEMLGQVRAIAVGPSGHVLIADPLPALREFDAQGNYVRTLGREGSGPGEYRRFDGGLVALADGRIVVRDPGNGRMNVYAPDGSPQETWPLRSGFSTSRPTYMDTAGNVYAMVLMDQQVDITDWRMGLTRYDPAGDVGDTLAAPRWDHTPAQITFRSGDNASINDVPFSPKSDWTFSPHGYFVGGLSTTYRVDLFRRGEPVLRIEHPRPAIPVDPAESAAARDEATENMRQNDPNWTWNGPEVPGTKPYFRNIEVGSDGRIWVQVHTPGFLDAEGEWQEHVLFDVFDPEGRYLGEVRGPDGFRTWPTPVFNGDSAWAAVQDELGVLRVKKLVARPVSTP